MERSNINGVRGETDDRRLEFFITASVIILSSILIIMIMLSIILLTCSSKSLKNLKAPMFGLCGDGNVVRIEAEIPYLIPDPGYKPCPLHGLALNTINTHVSVAMLEDLRKQQNYY